LVGWLSSVLRPRQHSIGYMGERRGRYKGMYTTEKLQQLF